MFKLETNFFFSYSEKNESIILTTVNTAEVSNTLNIINFYYFVL